MCMNKNISKSRGFSATGAQERYEVAVSPSLSSRREGRGSVVGPNTPSAESSTKYVLLFVKKQLVINKFKFLLKYSTVERVVHVVHSETFCTELVYMVGPILPKSGLVLSCASG